ncbi:multicopper oxidase-domain-containing protein [Geopyxis carbonaria]|nr:multicopper oxidase-domain-containing protein [Geopyxis carbonaria]
MARHGNYGVLAGALSTFIMLAMLLHLFFLDYERLADENGDGDGGGGKGGAGKEAGGDEKWRRSLDEYTLSKEWDARTSPQTRYYNWTVTEIVANPDGVYRPLLTINSLFPGPLVRANTGDTLIVDVHNTLPNSTSIHWHGQLQNGTNHMDGTAGITSCPIPPGKSFRYRFTVQVDAGTYWYHAHVGTQRVDGLFGPLVVHGGEEGGEGGQGVERRHEGHGEGGGEDGKGEDGGEFDSDTVVMVQDYYHAPSAALLPAYLAPGNENAEPIPNGALINGRNIFPCPSPPSSSSSSPSSPSASRCNTTLTTLFTLPLHPGKRHRLRFINVGAFTEFDISLDTLPLTLLAIDGTPVDPASAGQFNTLRINVAQRYDVAVTAPAEPVWMRAKMLAHCFAAIPPTLALEARGIIAPPNAARERAGPEPKSQPWGGERGKKCVDMNLTSVVPRQRVPAPPATRVLHLRTNFEIGAYKLSRGFINATSWRPAHTPVLSTLVDALGANATLASTPGVVSYDGLDEVRQLLWSPGAGAQVVDMLVSNFDDGNHPLHLHGHVFWVIASGTGYATYPLSAEEEGRGGRGEWVRRDTVTVPAFGWAMVRVRMENAGVWALHCHLAWHSEAGMMGMVVGRPEVVAGWGEKGKGGKKGGKKGKKGGKKRHEGHDEDEEDDDEEDDDDDKHGKGGKHKDKEDKHKDKHDEEKEHDDDEEDTLPASLARCKAWEPLQVWPGIDDKSFEW